MKKILLVMSLLITATLAGCGTGNSSQENGEVDKEPAAIPVEASSARLGTVSALYSATATLESDGEAKVVPRTPGRIVELRVEEGDRVEKGQVLARIDRDRLQLEVARAEADLSRLRQDFNRHSEMHQRSLISTEAFERQKYEFEAQQAQVNLARLELSYTDITAPFAGVVTERMIRIGNMVNTTEPAFVVTVMDPLQATLHVPERELARLRAGQTAMLQADALPGERFAGQVARISPVVDAASGTFRVTVELSDPSGRLRPGMFGRFSIVHDQREQAVLVPVEAVLTEDGRTSVFVVNSDEAQRRTVVTGYRNNGEYEIIEGLDPGDRVVVTGQASLRSGSRVLVIGDEPSPDEMPDEVELDPAPADESSEPAEEEAAEVDGAQ